MQSRQNQVMITLSTHDLKPAWESPFATYVERATNCVKCGQCLARLVLKDLFKHLKITFPVNNLFNVISFLRTSEKLSQFAVCSPVILFFANIFDSIRCASLPRLLGCRVLRCWKLSLCWSLRLLRHLQWLEQERIRLLTPRCRAWPSSTGCHTVERIPQSKR